MFFKIITCILKQKMGAFTHSLLTYNAEFYWLWKYTKKVLISLGWTVTAQFSVVSVMLKNPVEHKTIDNSLKNI